MLFFLVQLLWINLVVAFAICYLFFRMRDKQNLSAEKGSINKKRIQELATWQSLAIVQGDEQG
ncbi:hypothetical protein [Neobacillus cucumis]|uniref:hypothetical protein n=1 Tax=Neobacillus cucumis TaxID=1740721 RepID=UPI00115B064A|nr:hypothetical protein [Neobacillus cucumis]